MDNSDQGTLQLDIETSQAIADCLCNPVVVRKILQNFSNSELFKLSFVNKLWCYEARSVMKRRGNIIATLKCDENYMCSAHLEAFRVLLPKMSVVPFSGISFVISALQVACQTAALDPIQDTTLDWLQLKSISLDIGREWTRCKGCPTFQLAKKVLQRFCDVLEEFKLYISFEQGEFIEEVLQDCCFPRLKILKLLRLKASDEIFLKDLVTRAPNLQELHAKRGMNLLLNVLEGRSVVPVCTSRVYAPFDAIPEKAVGRVRLQKMELLYSGPDFLDFERFNRITPRLLQASCPTTLREMRVDAVLAVTLLHYRVSLENVKDLKMDINYRELELVQPRILKLLKDFDFTHIFPNVNKVTITSCNDQFLLPDQMNTIMDAVEAVLREPAPDRAAKINNLALWQSMRNHSVQFVADMFPNIERLDVREYDEESVPFGSIWTHVVLLKELDFHAHVYSHVNLDSAFCGIFPEEVAELRVKDEEYLKRVNIVPVAPSITCLRNLRTLGLNYYGVRYGQIVDDRTFIFSKVTGLVALARCPNLAVTLQTDVSDVYEAMGHLKPYASVVHDNCKFRLPY